LLIDLKELWGKNMAAYALELPNINSVPSTPTANKTYQRLRKNLPGCRKPFGDTETDRVTDAETVTTFNTNKVKASSSNVQELMAFYDGVEVEGANTEEYEFMDTTDDKNPPVDDKIIRSPRKKLVHGIKVKECDLPLCVDCGTYVLKLDTCFKCGRPLHGGCGFLSRTNYIFSLDKICAGCNRGEKRYRAPLVDKTAVALMDKLVD
jgi:ribosomal protein L32